MAVARYILVQFRELGNITMEIEEIKKKVLEQVKTPRHFFDNLAIIQKKLEDFKKTFDPSIFLDVCIGGSIAKKTNIGEPDIDIFLTFNPLISKEKLKEYLINAGKILFDNFEHRTSGAFYLRGCFIINNVEYFCDFVPIFPFKEHALVINPMDRSMAHVTFINTHLTAEMKEDVKFLKIILKKAMLYSTDQVYGGFSGYLVELLIFYFKNIQNLISFFANQNTFLNFNKQTPHTENYFEDPVDSKRNIFKQVSNTVFFKFIFLCKKLQTPRDLLKFLFLEDYVHAYKPKLYKLKNEKIFEITYSTKLIPSMRQSKFFSYFQRLKTQIKNIGEVTQISLQITEKKKGWLKITVLLLVKLLSPPFFKIKQGVKFGERGYANFINANLQEPGMVLNINEEGVNFFTLSEKENAEKYILDLFHKCIKEYIAIKQIKPFNTTKENFFALIQFCALYLR